MLAFEIHLNGKKRCLAGLKGEGVVTTFITRVKGGPSKDKSPPQEHVSVRVGGLDSRTEEHMDWLNQPLKIGDDIQIRIVEVLKVGAPIKGSRRPMVKSEENQKAHVRRMAKKFGWTLSTTKAPKATPLKQKKSSL